MPALLPSRGKMLAVPETMVEALMVTLFAQILAALVIGHPVPTTCASINPWWGYHTDPPNEQIVIADWLCAFAENQTTTEGFAWFAYTITHESEHAAGIIDEHDASCEAIRDLPAVLDQAARTSRWVKKNKGKIAKYAEKIRKGQPPPYSGKCKKK